MSFSAREGRVELLDRLHSAAEELAVALACLSEAYELVPDQLADALEEQLFAPVQAAYALARRTASDFAARHRLSDPPAAEGSSGARSGDPRTYLARVLESVQRADAEIAELQDSMLPVEVGDRELRDGLTETRRLVAHAPGRARELLRTVGR